MVYTTYKNGDDWWIGLLFLFYPYESVDCPPGETEHDLQSSGESRPLDLRRCGCVAAGFIPHLPGEGC